MRIDVEEILRKIHRKTVLREGPAQCRLWTGATRCNGHYGYMTNPFHQYENQPKFTYVHRLVYLLHHIDHYPGFFLPSVNAQGHNLHVSHLCHTSLCISANHLCLEPQHVNNERNTCKLQGHCIGIHNPKCIFW